MSNIHTLEDIPQTDGEAFLTLTPARVKSPTTYPFKKDKKWKKALQRWYDIGKANDAVGIMLPVPINKATKRPMGYVKFAVKHARGQRWNMAKVNRYINDKTYHQEDCDLGVLFEGGIGVLDFDCQKEYEWFVSAFEIDPTKYIIVRNKGKHNCSCDRTEEYTYHLYFEKSGVWQDKLTACPCIYDDKMESLTHIDYLRDSQEGTPHVTKCYATGSEREIIHCPDDNLIVKLPEVVTHYFKGHWKKSKREVMLGDRNMRFIELVESINPDIITSKDMELVCRELVGVGIDCEVIVNLTLDIRNRSKFEGRIGEGPSARYTEDEHLRWINGIIDTHVTDGQRRTGTINRLSKIDIGQHTNITRKWLDQFGTTFAISYLHDLKRNVQDEGERGKKMLAYYNHFFIQTSGMKKNGIWFRKYDTDNKIVEIGEFQTLQSFTSHCGIQMICYPNGKAINTAKYWFEDKSISYDQVIFQPFGLKRNSKIHISPNTFNTFTGYRMRHVPDYKKPAFDHMGDLINQHLRKVICWNGHGKDEVNEELYLFWLAWLHKLIIKGERTHVMMVNYSKGMGSGKSLLSSGLMKHVLGDHICMLNSSFNKMIKDTFTDYWDTNVLTTLEEMPEQSTCDKDIKSGWDFIKALITEDKMTSRKFMTAPDKMDIHTNLIINSNHFYAIHPDIPVRRAQVNRISPHYIGDNEYFAPLVLAIDSYEGWENFVHRYLDQGYHKFSHMRVIPNESYMIDTQYRKELLARGDDAIIYFFKRLMEDLADTNDEVNPFAKVMGKHITLQKMYEKYEEYRMDNGIVTNGCKGVADFEKKLMAKLEINIKSLSVKSKYGQPLQEGLAGGTSPSVIKTRMGKAIIVDEHFINQIQRVIKNKTLNEDDELLMTEDEHKDLELDLDDIMTFEHKHGNQGYQGHDF